MNELTDQDILKQLHLDALEPEMQKTALEQVNYTIEMRMAATVEEVMNDEQKKAFAEMEQKSPEQVFDWLSKNVVDLKEVYQNLLQDYIKEVNDTTAKF